MYKCWILRHGPTDWNKMKIIQGLTDMPLSDEGMAIIHDWTLPDEVKNLKAYASPLSRAYETATMLGYEPTIDPLLIEMDWGRYEGENLDFLRMEEGSTLIENEARGRYFQPPRGETPAKVQERLQQFFRQSVEGEEDIIIFAHKGVLRALYSLATDWDMVGPPDEKIRDNCIHCFKVYSPEQIEVEKMNISLFPNLEG